MTYVNVAFLTNECLVKTSSAKTLLSGTKKKNVIGEKKYTKYTDIA